MSRDPEDQDDETTFFDMPINKSGQSTSLSGSNPPSQAQVQHPNPNFVPPHLRYTKQNQGDYSNNHNQSQYPSNQYQSHRSHNSRQSPPQSGNHQSNRQYSQQSQYQGNHNQHPQYQGNHQYHSESHNQGIQQRPHQSYPQSNQHYAQQSQHPGNQQRPYQSYPQGNQHYAQQSQHQGNYQYHQNSHYQTRRSAGNQRAYRQQQNLRQQQQQNMRHQPQQGRSRQIPPAYLKAPKKKLFKDFGHHISMLFLFLGLTGFSITMGFLLLGISVSDLMKPIEKYEAVKFDWAKKDKKKAKEKVTKDEPEQIVIEEDYIQPSLPLQSSSRRLIADNARETVNGNLRSGKIDSIDQLRFMRDEYGIKRVINLAYDSTFKQTGSNCGRAKGKMCERIWAKQLGLEFYYLPLTDRGPKPEDWETIRELMLLGENLIHCTHGADRTGAVIGRFRLEFQPLVTEEEILEEALKYGFKHQNFRYKGGKLDPNQHLRRWMLGGER